MTVTITDGGGQCGHLRIGQRHHPEPQHPYINKNDARHAADRIVEGSGAGTVRA